MSKKDYVPGGDKDFAIFADDVVDTSTERHEDWEIPAPDAALKDAIADFKAKLAVASDPNRGKVDVLEKDEARKVAEKAIRTYVQGFLAKNPNVSDGERERMGLTVYDTQPTPIMPPSVGVDGELYSPEPRLLEIRNIRPFGGHTIAKAEYGVRIYYGIVGEPDAADRLKMPRRPESPNELPHSVFTRKKSHRFDFTDNRGREAFFCMRYENSKGEAGPWGEMMNAFIP